MEKKQQFNFWYFLIAVWGVLLFQSYFGPASRQADISYSQFETWLEDGRISRIAIDEQYIRGEFTQAIDGKTTFITPRLDPALAQKLAQYNVEFTGVVSNTFVSNVISWVAPAAIFLAMWMFVFRKFADKQGLGGMMNIGKTSTRVLVEKNTGVTFDDVAGVDEAKEELLEVVNFLKDSPRYSRLGARIPKGVLLVGPPGTGKTLLARAVAGQAGVPFFSISGSEFVELFVGVGAARVRDLFEQARLAAPSIIFIDELDALGRARGFGQFGGGHDEKEQTLNQLLSELDGFDPSTGIVLLAATNRPEILDPALTRAGRFDRQVLVDRPDRTGRVQILKVHVRKITLDPAVVLDEIAALTPGFTGADLANLVNEAALIATRRDAAQVSMSDFTAAVERVVAGLERHSRVMNAEERHSVAVHETGHALVACSLPGMDPVHKVSIIPRGIGALGYTIQRPTEDRFLMSRQNLKDKMAVLMGGRAAEALVFGEISTGAADDLDKLTEIARHMVMRYGMADEVGQVVYDEAQPHFLGEGLAHGPVIRAHSEATGREIDLAVKALVDEAFSRAGEILATRRAELDACAALLLAKETLNADELPFARQRA